MIAKINYDIRADIVDICDDNPTADEKFLVDTNVWLWLSYSNINNAVSPPLQYQTVVYPNYISKALGNKATLLKCSLCFSELASQIEKTEHSIYCSSVRPVSSKEYRHNCLDERKRVLEEINGSWFCVRSMAEPVEITVNKNLTDNAVQQLRINKVDAYDLFILNAMNNEGINQIITDDGDFATVEGIIVFTANKNIIKLAERNRKLLKR